MDAECVNKILQSKAYARYVDKTQVAYLIENDHITKRGLHVQMVSRLSREVGGDLKLNLDLIESIALGHDVGHPPFGHEGKGTCPNCRSRGEMALLPIRTNRVACLV